MKKSHRITVLGRELTVKSSAEPEMVREVEEFVNNKIKDIASVLSAADAQLVLTLALLNTAEELLSNKKKNEATKKADTALEEMLNRLSVV